MLLSVPMAGQSEDDMETGDQKGDEMLAGISTPFLCLAVMASHTKGQRMAVVQTSERLLVPLGQPSTWKQLSLKFSMGTFIS